MNPNHTVPVLVDDDLILTESRAILTYLVEKIAPGNDLYPKDLKVRAKIDQFLHFDGGELIPILRPCVKSLFWFAQDPTEESIKNWNEKVGIVDKYLEGKNYFVAEHRTLADVTIYATLSCAQLFGGDGFEGSYNVQRWYKNIQQEIKGHEEINVIPNAVNVKLIAELRAKATAIHK